MLTSLSSLFWGSLEYVGVVANPVITEEELQLVKRLQRKFKEEVLIFKEHKGFVTQLSNNAIQLDHRWEYQLGTNDRFSVGDRVSYKVYKTLNCPVVKDVMLLSEKEHFISKTVSGTITNVDGNMFELSRGFKFDLSKIRSEFLPNLNDYVMLEGEYPKDMEDPEAFELDFTLFKATRVFPSTTKLVTGVIESFNSETRTGVIGRDVVFHQNVCDKFVPNVGDNVVCNAIEGKYDGNFKWRAESMSLNQQKESSSRHFFVVANVPKFKVVFGETKIVELCLSNHGNFLCTVVGVQAVNGRGQSAPLDAERERVVLPRNSSITWPVNVTGDRLGTNVMRFKWHLNCKRKPYTFTSSICFDTVEQDLGNSEQNNDAKRVVQPQMFIPGQSRVRKPIFRRVPMKDYMIPDEIREVIESEGNYNGLIEWQLALQRQKPLLAEGLTSTNYGDWMHTLLFLEELAEEQSYKKLETKGHLFRLRGYVVFSFPAESEYTKIVCGDSMIVSKPWEQSRAYEGKIWEVSPSQIFCKFNTEFEETMRQGAIYSLVFKMNRNPNRKRHQAIDIVLKNIGADWLFPSVSIDEELETDELDADSFRLINTRLNNEQKSAVRNIMAKKNLPYPYVIYGPPGTGKTMTVIELILQLYANDPKCRILVGAPTNSAVDTLGSRLLEFGVLQKEHMVRLSSYNAYSQGSIATQLLDISFVPHLGDPSSDSLIPDDREQPPTIYLNDLGNHRITIGTLTTLSILNSAGLGKGFFTHIIVDEAGQCHEPETLLPIALVDPGVTQLVLAGDPMQLGPTITSRLAQQYQFGRSYLDRLTSLFLYKKKIDAFESYHGFNPRLITRLVYNYRSLPQIVDLVGGLFYDSDLSPVISANESREAQVLKKLEIRGYNLSSKMPSLIFINIDSREERIDGNFSWYNSGEVVEVLNVLNSLYEKGVSPDDVGVITPYSLQVRKIYELLDSLKVFSPKVASVEEFQGQERDVIIMSLVRNNLGISKKLSPFVTDGQRINVALSRARLLNVIIGNRFTLAANPMWVTIISKCHVINVNSQNDST